MHTPRTKIDKRVRKQTPNHAYDNFTSKWKSVRFATLIIREMAEYWNCSATEACARMNSIGVLENDIIKYYEVLHTQGIGYIVPQIDAKWERNSNV